MSEKVKTSPINFHGSRISLIINVKHLGFKYKKVESGRKYLMERKGIVAANNKYLREIKMNRESSHLHPEVYLDENWVNRICWAKLKSGRGARFIVLKAGGSEGTLLMFR